MSIRQLTMEQALLRPRREAWRERTVVPEGPSGGGILVCGGTDEDAALATEEWLWRVETGGIGGGR